VRARALLARPRSGTSKWFESAIATVARLDDDDLPWALVDGTKGYVAIVQEEPGSQGLDLALAECSGGTWPAWAWRTMPRRPAATT